MIPNSCRYLGLLMLLATGCTYNPVRYDPVSGFHCGGGVGVLCGGPLDPWMLHCCQDCGSCGPCNCAPVSCPAPICPPACPAPICPAPVCAPMCPAPACPPPCYPAPVCPAPICPTPGCPPGGSVIPGGVSPMSSQPSWPSCPHHADARRPTPQPAKFHAGPGFHLCRPAKLWSSSDSHLCRPTQFRAGSGFQWSGPVCFLRFFTVGERARLSANSGNTLS